MPEGWENLTVGGQAMRAFTAAPEGSGPFPAVVVAMHAGGVDPFIQEMTRRLGAAGYLAIAPDLYHLQEPGGENSNRMGRLRDNEIIQDVNATVEFLQAKSVVRGDQIGIVGFCMGGRVVFLMAAVNPAFKAAVPFYAGNMWKAWGDGPSPFEQLATTHSPVLAFFGEEDGNPSPEEMRQLDAELTRLGKPHEFRSYPGAGHAYMDSTNPNRYRQDAADASWPIALGFFEKHLGRVPAAR